MTPSNGVHPAKAVCLLPILHSPGFTCQALWMKT